MTNGSIVLNTVSDKQLAQIMDFKALHEGQFGFNPTTAKPINPTAPSPSYLGVTLTWSDDNQLKTVIGLVSSLL